MSEIDQLLEIQAEVKGMKEAMVELTKATKEIAEQFKKHNEEWERHKKAGKF